MTQFQFNMNVKASMPAQMIVHIYNNNLLLDNTTSNIKVKETIEFIQNGNKSLTYNEKCMQLKDKITFHYFENDIRKRVVKNTNNSFEMKKKLLNVYKSGQKINQNVRELINKLTTSEKSGEIRPTFDLWTKILWFLPFNVILLLFDNYEKQFEDALKHRTKVRSKSSKHTNNSKIIYECNAENSVHDVKNITIFNDVIYLCENLVPIFEKELDDILARNKIVKENTKKIQEVLTEKPNKKIIEEYEVLDSWEDLL